ncbi:MAG: cytochrome d ubiquinol oxidase subunit II [Aliidongia sp.]
MVEFWTAALALVIFLYVLLDGFDLGVGILFGLARTEPCKQQMLHAISPVWDGNETWLVIAGAVLFGAFPVVYSLLLSAFYIPLILMLCGLILRGVAFEFREKSTGSKPVWDAGFALGSLVAAFVQGCAVGALAEGLPNSDGRFTGGLFFWAQPFPVLCGIGLCLGYALIGASWLIGKTEGELRDRSYRQALWLLAGVLLFLMVAFVVALELDLRVMNRWVERPYLAVFPILGAVGCGAIVFGLGRRQDNLPFQGSVLLFATAFGTLAASFLPYMVPSRSPLRMRPHRRRACPSCSGSLHRRPAVDLLYIYRDCLCGIPRKDPAKQRSILECF